MHWQARSIGVALLWYEVWCVTGKVCHPKARGLWDSYCHWHWGPQLSSHFAGVELGACAGISDLENFKLIFLGTALIMVQFNQK